LGMARGAREGSIVIPVKGEVVNWPDTLARRAAGIARGTREGPIRSPVKEEFVNWSDILIYIEQRYVNLAHLSRYKVLFIKKPKTTRGKKTPQ
jgi:hypothetical protein